MSIPRVHMILDLKQRIVELITSIRQHPMVASFSPRNSLNVFIADACIAALLEGRAFVLPHHLE